MKGAVHQDWAHVTLNQDFDGDGEGFGNLCRGVWTVNVEATLSSVLEGAFCFALQDQARRKGSEEERRHLRQGSQ